jgi:hypothetical protein
MNRITQRQQQQPQQQKAQQQFRHRDDGVRARRKLILSVLAIGAITIQIVVFSQYLHHSKNDNRSGNKNNNAAVGFGGSSSFKMLHEYLDGSQYKKFVTIQQNRTTKRTDKVVDDERPELHQYHDNNNNNNNNMKKPDGTFNGYPIYKKQTIMAAKDMTDVYSQFHCVGETWHPPHYWKRKRLFQDVSWQHRSCHFQFFCYDVSDKEFVLYLNQTVPTKETETTTTTTIINTNLLNDVSSPYDVSQTYYNNITEVMSAWRADGRINRTSDRYYPYGVSIGSINGRWGSAGIPRLQWFPQVRYGPVPLDEYDVYTLPSHVVMTPFHSLAATNPGHMVWDDYLPLYTLLQIFGFSNDNDNHDMVQDLSSTPATDLLMVRFVLPPYKGESRGLWAGCDWRDDTQYDCEKMLRKFAPLMIRQREAWNISTQVQPSLTFFHDNNNNGRTDHSKKRLVCSKNGLAGIGGLSDHGTDKGHGWNNDDYKTTYNHGRGGQLWRFRNFMMRNIGVSRPEDDLGPEEPLVVYFSEHSSGRGTRSLDFRKQIQALETKLSARSGGLALPKVIVEGHTFSKFTVKEQVDMASKAAVYVTACGGGAITATFLPRGASLLLYYAETGGVKSNRLNGDPARLDWDYMNNLGYLRVHWLPQSSRYTKEDTDIVTDLIIHELEIIHQERKNRDRKRRRPADMMIDDTKKRLEY